MSTGRLPSVDGGIQPTIVDAKGDLIVATAADTVSRLAVGSNDQVLTADSTTATGLKWATAAAGGMTLISTTTLSGASISLDSIPQTYVDLKVVVLNFRPSTDGAYTRYRFNNDSTASRYYNSGSYHVSTATAFNANAGDFGDSTDNTTSQSLGEIYIPNYANTSTWKYAITSSINTNEVTTTSFKFTRWWTTYNQTSAISSIQIFPDAGNFSAGTVLLYGVK